MENISKFFCENCGKEVKRNSRVCPHCGRLFASVRCPACNYTNRADSFINGCPRCGYALRPKKKQKHKTQNYKQKKRIYYNTIPIWLYVLVFTTFFVVVLAMIFH